MQFQYLDPLSGSVRGHTSSGLMRVFCREYIAMRLLLVLRVRALCEALTERN